AIRSKDAVAYFRFRGRTPERRPRASGGAFPRNRDRASAFRLFLRLELERLLAELSGQVVDDRLGAAGDVAQALSLGPVRAVEDLGELAGEGRETEGRARALPGGGEVGEADRLRGLHDLVRLLREPAQVDRRERPAGRGLGAELDLVERRLRMPGSDLSG